jgi:ubiquinone/menaquinone biosynthesis C-methylase UbiE
MAEQAQTAGAEFWDALARHHASLENHYLDVPAIRRIMDDLRPPVLVVGAGQGLVVEEIRKAGLECDGVDLSREMIRFARLRRGIALIHAHARALPFADQAYESVVFATGVIDFAADDDAIKRMLQEGRRVVRNSGTVFVAFYRLSAASEAFLKRLGLLKNNAIALRESMELYLLNLFQTVGWVARKAGVNRLNAAVMLLRMSALSTPAEKRMTLRMKKIIRGNHDAQALIESAPKWQPYRDKAEVGKLLERLGFAVKRFDVLASCYIARIK